MNLNSIGNAKIIPLSKPRFLEKRIKSAFHAAGIASAIYLGNKQKGLPPVYFQISNQSLPKNKYHTIKNRTEKNDRWIAKVEGGMLISHVPESIEDATKNLNQTEQLAYERAFDADIINLFAGSIASANYVALRDDEVITPRLVHIAALQNYCSKTELDNLHQRIACIDSTGQDRKIISLYLQAFKFVIDRANWQAIEALSNFLLTTNKIMISYDDIVALLERTSGKNQQLSQVS